MSEDARLDLLARCANGDETSLTALVLDLKPRIEVFARRRLFIEADVDDVVSEAMYVIWRSAGRFGGRSPVQTWALGIARRLVANANRRGSRLGPTLDLEVLETGIGGSCNDPPAHLVELQEVWILKAAIAQLSDRKRAVVQMHYFDGQGVDQIAQAMQISSGTVKTRLMSARRDLRRAVQLKHLGQPNMKHATGSEGHAAAPRTKLKK